MDLQLAGFYCINVNIIYFTLILVLYVYDVVGGQSGAALFPDPTAG